MFRSEPSEWIKHGYFPEKDLKVFEVLFRSDRHLVYFSFDIPEVRLSSQSEMGVKVKFIRISERI